MMTPQENGPPRYIKNPWFNVLLGEHSTRSMKDLRNINSWEPFRRKFEAIEEEIDLDYLMQTSRRLAYDMSIHSGIGGIIYMYYELNNITGDLNYLLTAARLADKQVTHRHMGRDRPSFLRGHVGFCAVALPVLAKAGELNEKKEQYLCDGVEQPRSEFFAWDPSTTVSNELMYGRAGYVWALLWLRQQQDIVNPREGGARRREWASEEDIRKGVALILDVGKQGARSKRAKELFNKNPPPLFWQWHAKCYLGMAHGMAGILAVLIMARKYLPSESDLRDFILPTVDCIVAQQFRSYNFPMYAGSRSDSLVQWCHGAPGITLLLLLAEKVSREILGMGYMTQALKCGEVTWERGLLTKGDSLCHGVAGNAFAFLWLYQTTLDEMWLQRARRFAGFIIKRTPDTITDPPECPFSLYGGIAGVQLFLIHLNQPLKAVFPALQLAPLEVLRAETYATVSFVAARATGKAVWTVRLEPPDTEDESGSGGRSGRRRVSSSSTGGGGEESSTRSSPDSAILSAVASRLKHQTRFRGRQKVAKVFFV